ncbi:MAG: hypothetical protein ABFS38_17900 [Bacteroidota bacterium]
MRTILSILIIAMCHLVVSGQSAEEEVIRLKQQDGEKVEEISVGKREKPGSWNLSAGTSFSYSRNFGSGMMYYAAPMYTMPLNQRWALHGGMIASHYQGLNNTYTGETLLPNSFSSMALFVAGSYQMNDRLILHGAGVKQLVSAPASPFTPYPMDDLSLGATYKLGNNFTIGATIHMNSGGGYYSSPFNRTGFQSPFFW